MDKQAMHRHLRCGSGELTLLFLIQPDSKCLHGVFVLVRTCSPIVVETEFVWHLSLCLESLVDKQVKEFQLSYLTC